MPLLFFILLICFSPCDSHHNSTPPAIEKKINTTSNDNPYTAIEKIPLPAGYSRINADEHSFAKWLRQLPLKKNKTVYTYNGLPKRNQTAQFAVIDISTGDKDLQQCADAVMRLRAEYLYCQKQFSEIDFTDNNNIHYRLPANASRETFDQYLQKVFTYCGTASLEKQLATVTNFNEIKPGDILIKGGSPGHAMMVMDVATNAKGEKIFMLAQSYMPAQDMHIVINPESNSLSPWYHTNSQNLIETPEWIFKKPCLKKWK